MPYVGYESEMPEPQDVHPDCWVRIKRQGDTVEILISREGNTWTSRAKFDIEGDYSDFMVPVILPSEAEEFKSAAQLFRRKLGRKDEEDIS